MHGKIQHISFTLTLATLKQYAHYNFKNRKLFCITVLEIANFKV